MTDITRPRRFVNGIADRDERRAFVRTPSGRAVALDLATGAVLWRSAGPCLPILAFDSMLLALRLADAGSAQLAPGLGTPPAGPPDAESLRARAYVVLVDASTGVDRRPAQVLELPDWVETKANGFPDVVLDAAVDAQGALTLNWSASARYRGGAAAPAHVMSAASREAEGAVGIDVGTGQLQTLDRAPDVLAFVAHTTTDPADLSGGLPPDVLEQCETPTRRYQLVVRDRGGSSQILVRALERTSGQSLWETAVDEPSARRPPPLRR